MAIDYKKELEIASKGMILIHDPNVLIKMIIRMIVNKVALKHAGMILHDLHKDIYVLNISRGETGVKIPAGFARFNNQSPIIKFFIDDHYKSLALNRHALLVEDLNKMLWQESIIPGLNGTKEFLHKVSEQLQMFNAVACVPAYYHDTLQALLLLGEKKDGKKFDQSEIDFFAALASDVSMAIRNARLFAELKKEADRNHKLFIQMTAVLGSTIEAKDVYTHGHTARVTSISLAIARQMNLNQSAEFSTKFLEDLEISALLHDIGKIGVPENILCKPDKLTVEEFEIMKKHTVIGAEILSPITEFAECRKGVKYHHERYDGKGYPEGLKGENIPMIAAIIAVADAFDAMTSDRPYRKGLHREIAVNEVRRNAGLQFNPVPVRAFLELCERGEV